MNVQFFTSVYIAPVFLKGPIFERKSSSRIPFFLPVDLKLTEGGARIFSQGLETLLTC